MRKLTLSLLAAATALTVGSVAAAQTAPAQPRQAMTRAAAEQRADKAFERLDANHDGKIDPADRAARQKARFDRVDANHDGQVSYAEFTALHARHDDDRKGPSARRDGQRGERFAHRGMHRMPVRGGFGHDGIGGRADQDGALTKAEFKSAALARFDRLDANRDGTVTRDEAKAARDNMRRQWQARGDARQG